jgi:hypothetical protein
MPNGSNVACIPIRDSVDVELISPMVTVDGPLAVLSFDVAISGLTKVRVSFSRDIYHPSIAVTAKAISDRREPIREKQAPATHDFY